MQNLTKPTFDPLTDIPVFVIDSAKPVFDHNELRMDNKCLRRDIAAQSKTISALGDVNDRLRKDLSASKNANAELRKQLDGESCWDPPSTEGETIRELREKLRDSVSYGERRNGDIYLLREKLKGAIASRDAYVKERVIRDRIITNLKKQLSEKEKDLSSLRGAYNTAETDHRESMGEQCRRADIQARRADALVDELNEARRTASNNARIATVAKRELREFNKVANAKIMEENSRLACDVKNLNELLMESDRQLSFTAKALNRCEIEKEALKKKLEFEEEISDGLHEVLTQARG